MNTETLLRRKQEAEARFEALAKNKRDIEEEMARLQGEFRLLNDLLKGDDSSTKSTRMRKTIEGVTSNAAD